MEIRTVKMRIGDNELEPRVAWSLIEVAPPLLGRLDIFDEFNITFKEKKGPSYLMTWNDTEEGRRIRGRS